MNKVIMIIVIVLICSGVLFASGLISFESNSNNTTNNTNLTNNTNNSTNITANDSISNANNVKNNSADSEHTQGKVNPNDVPSDIYSKWDTDGDGVFSSSELDVHDRSLGQGKYYTGHENMKDSASTYPE